MSRGKGPSNLHIDWNKNPVHAEQDAIRKAREEAVVIVKVIIPIGDTEATIYREGRIGLKHQELNDSEIEMMAGDYKAYFRAKWSNSDVKWVLLSRATKKDYHW